MNPLHALNLLLFMALTLFLLGFGTFITGMVILARRANGKEVEALAAQTAGLAKKGLAEDLAGLVGNATHLLDAVNQMVRTTAGIGVMLACLGLALMAAACFLALRVYQVQP